MKLLPETPLVVCCCEMRRFFSATGAFMCLFALFTSCQGGTKRWPTLIAWEGIPKEMRNAAFHLLTALIILGMQSYWSTQRTTHGQGGNEEQDRPSSHPFRLPHLPRALPIIIGHGSGTEPRKTHNPRSTPGSDHGWNGLIAALTSAQSSLLRPVTR